MSKKIEITEDEWNSMKARIWDLERELAEFKDWTRDYLQSLQRMI